jgi:O-antigen/teichoic acid export membrane protein
MKAKILKLFSFGSITSLLSIAMIPVIARIFPPQIVGEYQAYVSIAAVLVTFFTFRFEQALVNNAEGAGYKHQFRQSLQVPVMWFIVLVSIHLLFTELNISLYHSATGHLDYPVVVLILAFLLAVYQLVSAYLNTLESYALLAKLRLAKVILEYVIKVGFGLLGGGLFALMFGELVGVLVVTLIICYLQKLPLLPSFGRHYIQSNKDFVLYNTPASLLNELSVRLPVIYLTFIGELVTAGLFFVASRLFDACNNLLKNSVSNVYFKEVANLANCKQFSKANQIFNKTFMLLLLISSFVCLLAYLIAPYLVVLFGERWVGIELFVNLLIVWKFSQLVCNSLAVTMTIIGKQNYGLWIISSFLIIRTTVLFVEEDFVKGLTHFAWASAAMYFVYIATMKIILIRRTYEKADIEVS